MGARPSSSGHTHTVRACTLNCHRRRFISVLPPPISTPVALLSNVSSTAAAGSQDGCQGCSSMVATSSRDALRPVLIRACVPKAVATSSVCAPKSPRAAAISTRCQCSSAFKGRWGPPARLRLMRPLCSFGAPWGQQFKTATQHMQGVAHTCKHSGGGF